MCCCLVYTSGTTGKSKGVMLSHDNLVFTQSVLVCTAIENYPRGWNEELNTFRLLSYLPLSHVAAMVCDVMSHLLLACELHFAKPDALSGSLKDTLLHVRPTWFLGVPRVWEKLEE